MALRTPGHARLRVGGLEALAHASARVLFIGFALAGNIVLGREIFEAFQHAGLFEHGGGKCPVLGGNEGDGGQRKYEDDELHGVEIREAFRRINGVGGERGQGKPGFV